jgi:hypothetical protein
MPDAVVMGKYTPLRPDALKNCARIDKMPAQNHRGGLNHQGNRPLVNEADRS